MWANEYYHVMDNHDKIIEMMMSTGLKTYPEHLNAEDAFEFIGSVKEGLMRTHPRQGDGSALFPFKHLMMVANKVQAIH